MTDADLAQRAFEEWAAKNRSWGVYHKDAFVDAFLAGRASRDSDVQAAEKRAEEAEKRLSATEGALGEIGLAVRDYSAGRLVGSRAARAIAQIRRILLADILNDQRALAAPESGEGE